MEEKEKAAAKPATKKPQTQNPRSLQRKLIRIRSDIGGTEFQNLTEFCQALIPLLNAHGINFSVTSETPVSYPYPEGGETKPYSALRASGNSGSPAVWIYESDLLCVWTNADSPKDTAEVLLHAVGCSAASPADARDAAWIRCIERYLLQIFFCWLKDDQACTLSHLSVQIPAQGAQAPQSGKDSQTGSIPQANSQTAQNGRTAAQRQLSDAQLSRMYRKGEAAGLDKANVDAWILKSYRQQDPHNLTRIQYDEACRALDNAAAEARNGGKPNV